jgi:hypothetical protein
MRITSFLFLVATLSMLYPASAQDSLALQLRRCAAISGVMERVACYDRLAGQSATQPSSRSESGGDAVASFGADTIPEPVAPPKRSPLNSITAQVTEFHFDSAGHFGVTLSNGQAWKQIEGDTNAPLLHKDKVYTATVSRGFLGSYDLSFSTLTGLFKVVRVR